MNRGIDELTDAALVQGALGDDGEAFGHLYRRFYPRLVRLIVRKTGDRALAEDVAQEALLRALDKLETFDRSRPLWPWLKVIAINLAVDVGRKRSREVEWDPEDAAGTAAKEMPSCEDGIVLAQVLANLPDRQRVAVSLRYLQDWESSEAASFLGLSIPAFEQLLFRARKRARLEYSRIAQGAFGLAGIPARWFRRGAARASGRFPGLRRAADAVSQMGPVTWAQAAAGGLALLALAPALPAGHVRRVADASVVARAGAGKQQLREAGRGPLSAARDVEAAADDAARSRPPSAAGTAPAPGRRQQLTDEAPDLKDVTDPTRDVHQPEDATIISIAWAEDSPGGERAFAIGDAHCAFATCPTVLFETENHGRTWKRLPARGLSGHALAIPPGSDGSRLFAMSAAGLQVSKDGGRSFTMVGLPSAPPLTGAMAISPAFDEGDPIMLIGGDWLLRYDDTDASYTPDASTPLRGPFEPVFSPDYPSDNRFLLGGSELKDGWLQSTVFACRAGSGCTWTNLAGAQGRPKIRLHPDYAESNVSYAFTDHRLFRSSDVWGYTEVDTAWPNSSWLRDIALSESGDSLFAAVDVVGGGVQGLYRSDDGGATWSHVRSPVFRNGARSIAINGSRMVVALPNAGLVCSADGGRQWSRRC